MNTVLLAIGLALGYLAVIIGAEVLRRKLSVSAEGTRRAIHIFSGCYTIWIFQILPAVEYLVLVVISLVVVALSKQFNILRSIHEVKRRTYGEILLPLGTLCSYAISQADAKIFIPSILVMTLSDSFAGIVTDYYKKTKQTWQGSVVFFISTVIILFTTNSADLIWALPIALAVSLVERYSPLGTDNLTVPIATSLLLLF